jgi:beta-phosphoglucomutase-like phosphatase (HAD superfamily)
MFSGYIFDVEGTPVDSVPRNLRCFQEALEQAGLSVPLATLQLYSGLDGDQTLQIIAPDMGETQRAQIVVAHALIYETKYLHSVKAFQGVREVFEMLTLCGGRIALSAECKGPELKRFRTILVTDALCSSADETHDAMMNVYMNRFGEQVETVTTQTLLASWPGGARKRGAS